MASDFTPHNLRRISDADVKVAENEPDIRGWNVVTVDDRALGEVEDLIVDTDAMKVRYVQLDPDESVNAPDREELYLPIEQLDLDHDRKRVVLRGAVDLSTLGHLVQPDIAQR